MAREYPRVGTVWRDKVTDPNIECEACGKRGKHWVWIQYSYMRGEDEHTICCERHTTMARENLKRLFSHCKTKAAFVSSKVKESQS